MSQTHEIPAPPQAKILVIEVADGDIETQRTVVRWIGELREDLHEAEQRDLWPFVIAYIPGQILSIRWLEAETPGPAVLGPEAPR